MLNIILCGKCVGEPPGANHSALTWCFLDSRKGAKTLFKPAVSPLLLPARYFNTVSVHLGGRSKSPPTHTASPYRLLFFSPLLNMNLLALHNKEGNILRRLYNRSKTNSFLYVCAIAFASSQYIKPLLRPSFPHWWINLLITV